VLPLTEKHRLYAEALEQFRAKWEHPDKRIPQVLAIYKVFSKDLTGRFARYSAGVERARPGHRQHSLAGPGNTLRRFHGTALMCDLGRGSDRLCSNADCCVCCIIKTGFQKQKCGGTTQYLRFGQGIYFSQISSKSYDYGNHRAVFIAQVAAGMTYAAPAEMRDAVEPPAGYDSINGRPGTTTGINYDELVVYSNNAAIPLLLLILGDP
jgi:hypothetical protein